MIIAKFASKYGVAVLALSMAACGGSAPLIGSRSLPDEMAVVAGPPLTLPPNFELRPPQEQKASRADALRNQDPSVQAKTILVGESAAQAQGEVDPWIAEQANVKKADPTIREKLHAENNPAPENEKDGGFLGLFGGDDE